MAKEAVRHYRMSAELAARVKEKADAAGMKESEYVRFLISQKPDDYPEIREGLKHLINEVNRIGVNINEIVHDNNSKLYRQSDKERLMAYMRRLNETVEKAVAELGGH